VLGQCVRSAELDARRARPLDPGVGPRFDQMSLQRRDAAKDRKHELAHRGRGLDPTDRRAT
jgi:hypothetical protein